MSLLGLFTNNDMNASLAADLQALCNKYQVAIKGTVTPVAPPPENIDIKPQ